MKLQTLKCPECRADLKIKEGNLVWYYSNWFAW